MTLLNLLLKIHYFQKKKVVMKKKSEVIKAIFTKFSPHIIIIVKLIDFLEWIDGGLPFVLKNSCIITRTPHHLENAAVTENRLQVPATYSKNLEAKLN